MNEEKKECFDDVDIFRNYSHQSCSLKKSLFFSKWEIKSEYISVQLVCGWHAGWVLKISHWTRTVQPKIIFEIDILAGWTYGNFQSSPSSHWHKAVFKKYDTLHYTPATSASDLVSLVMTKLEKEMGTRWRWQTGTKWTNAAVKRQNGRRHIMNNEWTVCVCVCVVNARA